MAFDHTRQCTGCRGIMRSIRHDFFDTPILYVERAWIRRGTLIAMTPFFVILYIVVGIFEWCEEFATIWKGRA